MSSFMSSIKEVLIDYYNGCIKNVTINENPIYLIGLIDDNIISYLETYMNIDLFYQSSNRSTSDEYNKNREEILCKLGNKEISEEWIQNDERWNIINTELDEKINELKPENCTHYKFIHRGGRKFNYDFEIHFYNDDILLKLCKIEFKYGANEISDCPQWVSPMHPSQYFNMSYEEFFYDTYLPKLCDKYELQIPDKQTYLDEIHTNKPPCMSYINYAYYKGSKGSSKYTGLSEDIENYKFGKQINNESIKEFLKKATFNVDKMNKYLLESQGDKIYLLWKDGMFNMRTRVVDDYQIDPDTIEIKNNNRVCGKTLSGCDIKMLLRWKNGHAFPGFQIS
tara:strand:+ start:13 stop:1026 length:1014 start_codon:yes stop_codon:yes gene_type:complete